MDHSTSRRDLIKKTLALAPIYVAPAILLSDRPVMAQISNPGCQGATCGNFIVCEDDVDCFCVTLADGSGFCSEDAFCSDLDMCDSNNLCDPGFVCALDTCCTVPVCLATSMQCLPGRKAGPRLPGRSIHS